MASKKYRSRIQERYQKVVVPEMLKKYKFETVMRVPRLNKIVLNMGVGDAVENSKAIEDAQRELTQLTGQKAVITKAHKSISNFKLRQGMNIGCKVTLRGAKMEHFLDKLISIALPRVRDFRGVSENSFDGRGNYTLGVKEQLIFPEIKFDDVKRVRGMDVVIVTTARSDEESREMLRLLGMPFKKNKLN